MGLTYRSSINRPLTSTEIDDNLRHFTGSHEITGALTATQGFVGSLTGSVMGNADTATSASYASAAETATSSSYADNAGITFPYTGDTEITGSLNVTGSQVYLRTDSFQVENPTVGGSLIEATNTGVNVWSSNSNISIDAEHRLLYQSDGSTVTMDWENGTVTASLHGTASYAENATTAFNLDATSGGVIIGTLVPIAPTTGSMYFNPSAPEFYIYDGTIWRTGSLA